MRPVALVFCTLTTLLVLSFAAAAPAAQAGSPRLVDDVRHAFAARRQHEHVGRYENLGNVPAYASEDEPIRRCGRMWTSASI